MDSLKPPSLKPSSPRSPARTPTYFIGKDSRGNWVVQDERHLHGGLFVDRAEAMRFALFENGHQPRAVIMVPGIFELDMNAGPARQQVIHSDASRVHRAA
jgi:hypothetical protein